VSPLNDSPVARDNLYVASEDTSVSGNVLADDTGAGVDSDADGDTLTVNTAPVSGPANGTLTLNSDGTFDYTPNVNFFGTDSFVYQTSDGKGGVDTATVTLTFNPVNDDPTANNNAYTTNEDSAVSGNVLTDDTGSGLDVDLDGDPLTVDTTPVAGPANGTLTLNSDGTFTYTPTADFNGADAFTYRISDGNGGSATATVTLTVSPLNDSPVARDNLYITTGGAVTGNVLTDDTGVGIDGDPDGEPLSVNTTPVSGPAQGSLVLNSDGSFTYTPDPTFTSGQDSFSYEVTDPSGAVSVATVEIDMQPVFGFAYDAFRNHANTQSFMTDNPQEIDRVVRLVAVDPMFSGVTEPGATIAAKIYDQRGNVIGERTTMADAAGNWMMTFSNSRVGEAPHRMEAQQISSIQGQADNGLFNLRRYYHPTTNPSLFFTTSVSPYGALQKTAHATLSTLHAASNRPLSFGWEAHADELVTASTTPAQI
ncbi:MAG: cadherin-like domain-containing protein, partial [Planctomycetota bacterium]|nr:cadherin-like domain-containing protein [Planctomycetota bacterium]